jgi:hypothetical protein
VHAIQKMLPPRVQHPDQTMAAVLQRG